MKKRVAIVGYGGQGGWHGDHAMKSDVVELAGIYDIKPAREEAQVVKCKCWHENDVLPVQTAAGITKTMAPRDEITTDTYTVPRPVSDVHDFYRNLVRAIDGKEEQLIKHSEVRRVLKVMEAALESDEKGSMPVAFDEEK